MWYKQWIGFNSYFFILVCFSIDSLAAKCSGYNVALTTKMYFHVLEGGKQMEAMLLLLLLFLFEGMDAYLFWADLTWI